jgi:nucleoside-diphosphate-sugar epimerase
MIAVVTGGSGFIGRNLVGRLLADGHTVRCLTRPGRSVVPDGCSAWPVQFDNAASLAATDALTGADVVFHLAGATEAVRARDFITANVVPTRNLLRAIAERRSGARFVYVSSQAAAGPASGSNATVVESDAPRPVESYGRSKLAAERVVEEFADRVMTTVVRPCAVFGPWDRGFHTLFRLAAHGFVVYPGVAAQSLSFLHASDVVDGMLLAGESPRAVSRTFFLASDEPVSWRQLGEEIAGAVGRPVRHVAIPWPLVLAASTLGDLIGRFTGTTSRANRSKAELARHSAWHCSAARARAELGFRQRRSLPEALRETYLWYTRNGWIPGARPANPTGT